MPFWDKYRGPTPLPPVQNPVNGDYTGGLYRGFYREVTLTWQKKRTLLPGIEPRTV